MSRIYCTGNAPSVAADVFSGDNQPIVYYLPGTTGWSSSWPAELPLVPTVLWNPLIQASGTDFGVKDSQFGFKITGTANIPIAVEACTTWPIPFGFGFNPVRSPTVCSISAISVDELPCPLLPHQRALSGAKVRETTAAANISSSPATEIIMRSALALRFVVTGAPRPKTASAGGFRAPVPLAKAKRDNRVH